MVAVLNRTCRALGLVSLLAFGWLPAATAGTVAFSGQVAGLLQTRLEAAEGLGRGEALRSYYAGRGYVPVWIGGGGPTLAARRLVRYLGQPNRDGIEPPPPVSLENPWLLDAAQAASLELRLTRAFLDVADALERGQTEPGAVDPNWHHARRSPTPPGELLSRVAAGELVASVFESLVPDSAAYRRLRGALADYRRLAREGGWPQLPAGPTLRPGERNAAVRSLRRRLAATEALPVAGAADPELFDAMLEAAVRRFQVRHGLEVDGVVGPATRAAMNVPVHERIARLRTALERWRWLPRSAQRRHLMVNTAAFTVTLYEQGFPLLEMRAVVGRPDDEWATPSFAAPIRSLVLNPSWNVPESIARAEILPRLLSDPHYLERAGLEAVAGRDDGPASVDLERLPALLAAEEEPLPFRLRQPAGPGNALGRVKLKMRNPFDIYLHDTPDRAIFARRNRALSHGCIRIEQPLRLAEYLLGEGWSGERLQALIDAGESLTLALPEPVPVQVAYLTAWVQPDGTVHFRDDLYGRDESLIALFDDARIELASNVN